MDRPRPHALGARHSCRRRPGRKSVCGALPVGEHFCGLKAALRAVGCPATSGFGFNPNSEVAAAKPPGSTGHWPVPSGDPPLGTGSAHKLFPAPLAKGGVPVVPSGKWPDGTGGSPVLPFATSEFRFNARQEPLSLRSRRIWRAPWSGCRDAMRCHSRPSQRLPPGEKRHRDAADS